MGQSMKLTLKRKVSARAAECWKQNLKLQLLPACRAVTLNSLGFSNLERENPECSDSTQHVIVQ